MKRKRLDIELQEFGRNVRYYRKKLNLTQLDLEILTKIDRAEISKIENGKNNIEFSTIIKLAEALEITTITLFHFEPGK